MEKKILLKDNETLFGNLFHHLYTDDYYQFYEEENYCFCLKIKIYFASEFGVEQPLTHNFYFNMRELDLLWTVLNRVVGSDRANWYQTELRKKLKDQINALQNK